MPAGETQGTSCSSPTKSGSSVVLPLSYAGLTTMAAPGDAVVLGRYLATGAEETSVYLTVTGIDGDAISCVASNAASLGGLLTVFHTERSEDGLANMQNDLPVLCAEDKTMIAALAAEFEVDFVSLSFARSGDDVAAARDFLDAVPGGTCATTKILAKLETRQSLFNFAEIASAADGIVLSRGNLGLDVLPEKMALVQKAVSIKKMRYFLCVSSEPVLTPSTSLIVISQKSNKTKIFANNKGRPGLQQARQARPHDARRRHDGLGAEAHASRGHRRRQRGPRRRRRHHARCRDAPRQAPGHVGVHRARHLQAGGGGLRPLEALRAADVRGA